MAFLQPPLTTLPPELLLEILECLADHHSPRASRDILHLSLVNHQLRSLCLPLLFSYLKCRSSAELQRLEEQCSSNHLFARSVRTLDVGSSPCDNLHQILPRLEFVSSILIKSSNLDEELLTMANRHPNLATIQIRDSQLKLLSWFPSANPSLFSKILVDSVSLDGLTCRPLMPSSRRFLSDSGMRVRRLKLFGSEISNHGFDSLSFQGLEILEVPMRVASLSWLSSFVQSQPDLKKIHFDTPAGCRPWCSNSYIPGGAEIHNCFNLEGLESAVALNAMSICRTPTSTSLDDWDVTELQLRLQSNTLDVLKLTNTFYPRTSTLVLDFHEPTDRNIHMDDLITSLSRFPLVNVKFVSARRHLHFGQEAPWATDLPASQPDARISKRLEVNAALHWFFLRLVHKISSIEILEVQEGGQEWYLGTWGRRLGNWSIDATYRVDANSLKVVGTPRLVPFDK